MYQLKLIAAILILIQIKLCAQTGNYAGPDFDPIQIDIAATNSSITLDGILDEPAWKSAQQLTNFTQHFPADSITAIGNTEIFFCTDASNLYIAAICKTAGENFVVESLKRDYGFGSNDNISFLLDTYNDQTNAYLFGMNPYGSRREALISNGGKTRDSFDPSWDNKWSGESKMYKDYWICELAIPFNAIRYKEGTQKWRFNSYRNDYQCNEISCYINIPRGNILMDLQYTAELNWPEPLKKTKNNISIIPYTSARISRDFEDLEQENYKYKYNIGGDMKISLSSSLNLDLTINPDFSQVDADVQVTNLDRFEIFFPERRQFFLENADLFSRFGAKRFNPFFSRRIGVSVDTITGNNIQNTIYGGLRLSGKINESLRVGILNMQTAAQRENDLPSYNYSVFAMEQKIFGRSSISAILVNKQAHDYASFDDTADPYDRVVGLEYRLRSKDNFWSGKTSFMKSFTPNEAPMKYVHHGVLEHNKRRFRAQWEHYIIGEGMDAEVGFVPRKDILSLNPSFDYRLYPKTEKISQITLGINTRQIYKLGKDDNEIIKDFGIEEKGTDLNTSINFSNNHRFNLSIKNTWLTLLEEFDPTRIQEDDIFLDAGSTFTNNRIELRYNSDQRENFYYRIEPSAGSFFGGTQYGIGGEFRYRFKPFGSISLRYNYNHIVLNNKFEDADLWLVGPRINFTFTKKLFWTTFVQYNNQFDNLNINSRIQWRFAPVSDFFLVYTDNYDTATYENIRERNRALVAKLTYWFNP